MTKEELAEHYIDENLVKTLREVYKDAYQKGFEEARKMYDNSVVINDVVYFDLCLPSGTLWSCAIDYFDYGYHLKNISYEEAQRLNIPTIEQWNEIVAHCRFIDVDGYGKRVRILGPNGVQAGFPWSGTTSNYIVHGNSEGCDNGGDRFWLKSNPDSEHLVEVIAYNRDTGWGIDKHFTGFKLPFFLVKNKNEI